MWLQTPHEQINIALHNIDIIGWIANCVTVYSPMSRNRCILSKNISSSASLTFVLCIIFCQINVFLITFWVESINKAYMKQPQAN